MPPPDFDDRADKIFALSPDVRYVAQYHDGRLDLRQRPGLEDASSSETDRYEELLVNPALLTLVQQRGNIDCGGARFVIIRYGNFFQIVCPTPGGHVSVAVESSGDVVGVANAILRYLESVG